MKSLKQKNKETPAELRYVDLVTRLSINWHRWKIIYVCLLFISLGAAEYFLLPASWGSILLIRFGIATPGLVTIVGLTYVRSLKKYGHLLIVCCISLLSIGTLAILSLAYQPESTFFYSSVGIALIIIWIQGAHRLDRFEAGFFSGLVFFSFIIVTVCFQEFTFYHLGFFFNNLVFLTGIMLLGSTVSKSRKKLIVASYRKRNTAHDRIVALRNKSLSSEKIRDRLISVISYDLRTPISSTKQILDLYARGLLDERQLNLAFGKLTDALDSTSILLDNVLSWSLLDFRKSVSRSKVNLQKIIDESVRLYKSAASLKDNRFVYEVNEKLYVEGDESMIGLVFRNLISNSVKFIMRGTIEIRVTQNDAMTEVIIKDTGLDVSRISSPELFRWESIVTGDNNRSGRGSDLGLLICKEIIEAHGGILSVSLNPDGRGVTFYFFLPTHSNGLEKNKKATFTKLNWIERNLN